MDEHPSDYRWTLEAWEPTAAPTIADLEAPAPTKAEAERIEKRKAKPFGFARALDADLDSPTT